MRVSELSGIYLEKAYEEYLNFQRAEGLFEGTEEHTLEEFMMISEEYEWEYTSEGEIFS